MRFWFDYTLGTTLLWLPHFVVLFFFLYKDPCREHCLLEFKAFHEVSTNLRQQADSMGGYKGEPENVEILLCFLFDIVIALLLQFVISRYSKPCCTQRHQQLSNHNNSFPIILLEENRYLQTLGSFALDPPIC